jgi:hypothetical protein
MRTGGALAIRIGRGVVSLAITFLVGTFLSAFVAMIAEKAGTPVRSEWLGLIVLAVMVGGFLPTHRLVWRETSGRQAARADEEVVSARLPGRESEG